jgi:AcrR family transcriptional regulator
LRDTATSAAAKPASQKHNRPAGKQPKGKGHKNPRPRSARLPPEERKKLIVEEAMEYFAEVGYEAGTRALADRLGITQPLIFRYFPNKDDLVQAVYNEVFLSKWRIEWERLLEDRTRPVRDRLIEFYSAYTEVIFNSKWMRIFLFAGLRGLDLNSWYISFAEDRIHKRVCREIRAEKGIKHGGAITAKELETFWTFHGGIFYYGVRRYAYGVPVHLDLSAKIEEGVDGLLNSLQGTKAARAR